jgi:hypothetical protein
MALGARRGVKGSAPSPLGGLLIVELVVLSMRSRRAHKLDQLFNKFWKGDCRYYYQGN